MALDLRRPRPARASGKKLIAFPWFGGKFHCLDWLLPLLPVDGVHHYCEPFGGSMAVLLNRPPAPMETYNDLDGEVVNFFRVLRDRGKELVEALRLTPYSREEFAIACRPPEEGVSDLERARRFFVRVAQARSARAMTATVSSWAARLRPRRAAPANETRTWRRSADRLLDVVDRILDVQIEHRPAIDVIRFCDSPQTLFYVDPPYVLSTWNGGAYRFEMTDDDHRELAEVLHSVRGMVAISGYRCDLMDELYRDWRRIGAPKKIPRSSCPQRRVERQEALWVNYDIAEGRRFVAHQLGFPVLRQGGW